MKTNSPLFLKPMFPFRVSLLAASILLVPATLFGQGDSDRKIAWADEFNDSEIDRSIWTHDVGGHGWGNGQLEYNTDRPENSYIKDGNLVLEARRESYRGNAFTSARLLTQGRFAFQYGDLEARIKLPDTADGIWPAYWMLGNNFPAIGWPKCGEIDILEAGSRDGIEAGLQHRKINAALHFFGKDDKKESLLEWFDAPADLHQDYHRYRVSWTPDYLKFFLDDQEYASWDITSPKFREYHQPFFPILNVAVGSSADSYTAVGAPSEVTAPFPSRMIVDWIRLYENQHTKVILGKEQAHTGDYGIYTEDAKTKNPIRYGSIDAPEFAYGEEPALLLWNNMVSSRQRAPAAEGDSCWTFDVKAGQWFGMGVFFAKHQNMTNYESGRLHFDIKSSSSVAMRVGIKSSRGGEAWVPLGETDTGVGFARDGQWHSIEIGLEQFDELDFHTIHQVFMLSGEAPSEDASISIDNVWWEPGS